jgi:hypothetical protein
MDNLLIFGTFNVPVLSQDALSASFTAPSNLPKEIVDKIIYFSEYNKDQKTKEINSANSNSKAISAF